MATVTLYDGETGVPIEASADESRSESTAVGLREAGVVLFVTSDADAAWLRLVVEDGARHLVARADLADDDLSDLYRAVQGRIQGHGEEIAHPRETPGPLNLVHYLAAPRPNPPDQSVRGHLVATDEAIEVEVPTAADAAGILAFFRERAPWKSLLVDARGAETATSEADVAITIDDSLEDVTYHVRAESWVDGDASIEALPEDDRVGALPGNDERIEAHPDDANASPAPANESGSSAEPGAEVADAGAERIAEAIDDAGGGATVSDETPTSAANATGTTDESRGTADRAAGDVADGERGTEPERSESTATGQEQSNEQSLAPHHERQFEEAVSDLRDDLVAIADQVDAITGTVQARQRVFAATLSGAVLAERGLTAVPDDDRRLESRRRQVRSLTLYVLVVAGLVAGALTGQVDALEPLLAQQFVLDLGTGALPVRGIVIDAPVLAGGSLLLAGAVALWLLAPGATPRESLAALATALEDQVTVVGSGTVPKTLRSQAEAVQSDLDDLEEHVETLAGREGASPEFATVVEQQLLATPGLPDAELLDRRTRRLDRLSAVARGLLVGAVGAGMVLGVLRGAVALAASRPALVLDALAGLAAVALLAAVVRGGVLAWRSGRPSAATVVGALGSPPATGDRSERSEAASGGTERRAGASGEVATGPATETRERNYDRPEGRSPGEGAESPSAAVTAPAYEHAERETPVVRERSNRSWRLLLSSLAFLVIVGIDVAVFRGPLAVPDAVPDLLAVAVMVLAPIVLAILAAVYWVLDV